MIYILTSSGNTLEVDVRLQEVRKGDPAIHATLALALKPVLSKEVFLEQQNYLITSSKAAFVALNKIDQRNRFKASVNIRSTSSDSVNLISGSSSVCLGFTLALFDAFWTTQLHKGEGLKTTIFATGQVQNNGDIKAISYLKEKLRGTIAFAKKNQLSQFIICVPESNVDEISDTLRKEIAQYGGQILSAKRIPDLLGLLLGNEYDGEALSRWEPFKGLKSFEYEDSIRFFGRDREIERLYDDLEHNRGILIVSGPSGSGKSSLVKAGLIPKLASQKSNIKWTSITPTLLSQPLITFLLTEILNTSEPNGIDENFNTNISLLIGQPETNFNELVLEINKRGRLFLLHIDQFEELFTQESSHKSLEDLRFIHKLTKATDNVKVVLSIRNEYLSILLESGFIASPVISNVSENVSVEAWREIVIQQAAFSGLNYEKTPENLAQRIINDAVNTSNALPMVEFVLEQLYEKAKQENISANYLRNCDYDSLGGITGAIAQRAEVAVKLSGVDDSVIHHFFSMFVGVTSDGIPYAKQVPIDESLSDTNKALTVLSHSLLRSNIVIKVDSSQLGILKLTHDSLFQHWKRLRVFLIEKASFLDWKNTIEFNYQRWIKSGFNKKYLINDNALLNEGVVFIEEHTLVDSQLIQYVNNSKSFKRKKIITNFSVFLFSPLLLILLLVWDRNITRSEYYAAVGHKWEVPFGVGRISEEQRNKKQFRYHFIYQGGLISKFLGYGDKVLELRHENSYGYLMRDEIFHDTAVAKTRYFYKESGKLDMAIDYDMSEKFLQKKIYQFQQDFVTVNFMDPSNYARNYQDALFITGNYLNITNIFNIKKTLNENGFVKSEEFFKDLIGNSTVDGNGALGYSYTHNSLGLKETKKFYSGTISPLAREILSFVNTSIKYSYNEFGIIAQEEHGYRLSKGLRAVADHPIYINYIYDNYGNYIDSTYHNYKGEKIKHNSSRYKGKIKRDGDGLAIIVSSEKIPGNNNGRVKIKYTDKGYIYRLINLDILGEPYEINGQVATEYHYNKIGQKNKTIFLNSMFDSVESGANGHSGYESVYNKLGQLKTINFLDESLEVVKSKSLTSQLVYEYNRLGLVTRVTSLNYLGELVKYHKFDCAVHTINYDQNFQKTSDSCFDSNNELTPYLASDHYKLARINYNTDKYGNLQQVSFFSTYGKPTLLQGVYFSTVKKEFDEKGRLLSEFMLDEAGNLVTNSECDYKCAGTKYSYDDNLNQFTRIFLDEFKKPVIIDGSAGQKEIRDEYGNLMKIVYLGIDEKPIILPEFEYAGVINDYDFNGNIIKTVYLGTDEKPMIYPEFGYAGVIKDYDVNGNIIKTVYLGTDEKPMIHPEYGDAGSVDTYDDDGNRIKTIWLGTNELPMFVEDALGVGYSFEYDEDGNIIKQMLLGFDHRPLFHEKNGYSGLKLNYDINGNVIKLLFLNVDEKPMIHPIDGNAGWIKTYDWNGKVLTKTEIDINGNPLN